MSLVVGLKENTTIESESLVNKKSKEMRYIVI